MYSLRSKIFFFFMVLLLAAQGISLWIIYLSTLDLKEQQISSQLNTASTVFELQFESRSYYLKAFSNTAAKDFGLKEVFLEDRKSFLVALNNHRQRIGADMAIAIGGDNHIVGQLINYQVENNQSRIKIGPEQDELFRYPKKLLSPSTEESFLYQVDNKIYQLSTSPIQSGSRVIGHIGFGYQIDQNFANQAAEQTNLVVSFSLVSEEQPWQLLTSSFIPKSEQEQHRYIVGEILLVDKLQHVIFNKHDLGGVDNQQLIAVLYNDQDDLLQAIQQRWLQWLGLVFLTLLLALSGAYILSIDISKPITILVKQAKHVASGHYTGTVNLPYKGEIGELAYEFNQMQQAIISREKTIKHNLYHENLTNLPNRNRLLYEIEEWIEQGKERQFSLFLIHIRHISTINDTLGYGVGDEVIIEVGKRLQQLQGIQFVSHLGGESFVLLKDFKSKQCNLDYLRVIEAAFELSFHSQNIALPLHIHIGVACFPEHADEATGLLKKVDTAVRQAKQKRVISQLYDSTQDINTVQRLNVINDLKIAIEQQQLALYYQPKLDLVNDKIVYLEALVRWIHPIHGLIPPDDFISIAEQTGQISQLTAWVINEACRQHRAWLNQGIDLKIAINISAENLKEKDFQQQLQDLLKKYQLSVDAITLEITESAVVDDPESAINLLNQLKKQGFKLSIDDYGTGYSSLAQLKQLPVHELKIDKSFILKLIENEDDQIIVASTIELAHRMGLSVVAEGVENQETIDWLKKHHCELAQGYHISRPLPAVDLIAWLVMIEQPK